LKTAFRTAKALHANSILIHLEAIANADVAGICRGDGVDNILLILSCSMRYVDPTLVRPSSKHNSGATAPVEMTVEQRISRLQS
jgi:hypothetical protein